MLINLLKVVGCVLLIFVHFNLNGCSTMERLFDRVGSLSINVNETEDSLQDEIQTENKRQEREEAIQENSEAGDT